MTPRREGRLRWRVALPLAVALIAAPASPVAPLAAISATDEPKAKAVSEGMSVKTGPRTPMRRSRFHRRCRCQT